MNCISFKTFGGCFLAIEVQEHLRLKFEILTSTFLADSEKIAPNLKIVIQTSEWQMPLNDKCSNAVI